MSKVFLLSNLGILLPIGRVEGLLHKEGNAQNCLEGLGIRSGWDCVKQADFPALLPTAHFSKAGEANLCQKLKMQKEMGTRL